jgi:hypothetical protein
VHGLLQGHYTLHQGVEKGMQDHVKVQPCVEEMLKQLLVSGSLPPCVNERRDQLALVEFVFGDVPSKSILLLGIIFDSASVVDQLEEYLIDFAWFEVDEKKDTDVPENGNSLDGVLAMHVHKNELKFVLSVLS